MPKIEIDENEYAELVRVRDVANLIGKVPEAREKLQEAVELAAPDQAGPEIRIRREVHAKLSGIEKRLDEDRAERAKEREEREADRAKHALEDRWMTGRRTARDAGYTDEGLEKLESWMEKEGVASHKVAMAAYERENPPPEPVATGNSRWDFFGAQAGGGEDALLDNFLKTQNDEAFLAAALPNALKEVRGR